MRVQQIADVRYGTVSLIVNDVPISFRRLPDYGQLSARQMRKDERIKKARAERAKLLRRKNAVDS